MGVLPGVSETSANEWPEIEGHDGALAAAVSSRSARGFGTWRVSFVAASGALVQWATPIVGRPTLAQRHQEHYRSCGCLGDSAECCVYGCECHDEQDIGRSFDGSPDGSTE
jgi:hypothetical protein